MTTASLFQLARPVNDQIAGYDLIQTLGTGAASTLYLVSDRKGRRHALKHVKISGKQDLRFAQQAIDEHRIAQHFDDPRIRKSHRIHKIRSFTRLREVAVVMEYVSGNTLDQSEYREPDLLPVVGSQIAQALRVMHKAGYVHADLKPNNILIKPGRIGRKASVKLIDLGQSCPVGTVKKRVQGTPDFMAPEQAKRRALDVRTDVFGLGATLYQLATGKTASHALRRRDQPGSLAITSESRQPLVPAYRLNPAVSPALSALLTDCLATRPDQRPASMEAVINRLTLAVHQAKRAG